MENSKKWDFDKYFFYHLYFFYIISTYTSCNKLRDSTSERERNLNFTSGFFNKHNSAVAEKNAGPCLCECEPSAWAISLGEKARGERGAMTTKFPNFLAKFPLRACTISNYKLTWQPMEWSPFFPVKVFSLSRYSQSLLVSLFSKSHCLVFSRPLVYQFQNQLVVNQPCSISFSFVKMTRQTKKTHDRVNTSGSISDYFKKQKTLKKNETSQSSDELVKRQIIGHSHEIHSLQKLKAKLIAKGAMECFSDWLLESHGYGYVKTSNEFNGVIRELWEVNS
jgi:hypothetical protein